MNGGIMLFRKKVKTDDEISAEDLFADEEDERTEETPEKGARQIVLPIILQFLLIVFVWLQAPAAVMKYLYCLVPLLLSTAFIGTWVYNRDGDMKLFSSIACLISIGIALQLTIDEVYATFTVFQPLKYAAGLGIAIVFTGLFTLAKKLLNRPEAVYVSLVLAAAVYILLYFKGYDPNGMGTNAWVKIGPFTAQLTDAAKVAAVLFYSSLFAPGQRLSETRILVISTVFFILNLAGSLMIHELGSFFILYFLHLSILFIFMEKGTKKRFYLLTIAGATVLALGTCYGLYHIMKPMADAGQLNSVLAALWPYVRKVYLRFSITANIYSDPYGAGYQLLQGKKALWVAGLFGNRVNFNAIPVVESDMAFIALMNSFGMLMGFAALYFFLRIMMSGSELALEKMHTSRAQAVAVYCMTVLICAQAAVVILGSCNLIPLAGLPIPYLSRGGTYQTIVLCFSGLLLYLSGSERGESDE